MSKRAIPLVPPRWQGQEKAFAGAIKENVERITGQRGEKIALLQAGATTEEIIAKLNEVIERLQ